MSSKRVFVTDELRETRTKAGRKGRGVSAIANSEPLAGRPNKQKALELQARIDMVVQKALSDQQSAISGLQDVMYGTTRTHGVRRGSLKVHRVG